MLRAMLLHLVTGLLFATLTIASSIPLNQQQPLAVTEQRNRTVSPALFTDLEELSRIVDISYCVGLTGTGIQKPFQCLSRCGEFENFELIEAWNTGPLLSDSCGYIALSHMPARERIVLAFRGTYSIANTFADLSTIPQEYLPYPGDDNDGDDGHKDLEHTADTPKCDNCTVHMGFYSSWLNTRHEILSTVQELVDSHKNYSLVLVGHSLGGAVAALAGLDFIARGWDPVVTTFGEPRIGNKALAEYLEARFNLTDELPKEDSERRFRRVTHVNDPVPLLPLEEWGYVMHGGEIYIEKPEVSPDIADVRHCEGREDPSCIAGGTTETSDALQTSAISAGNVGQLLPGETESRVVKELRKRWNVEDVVPPRYRLWQLFFAHRDYFWRLGLCVPTSGWLGGGPKDT